MQTSSTNFLTARPRAADRSGRPRAGRALVIQILLITAACTPKTQTADATDAPAAEALPASTVGPGSSPNSRTIDEAAGLTTVEIDRPPNLDAAYDTTNSSTDVSATEQISLAGTPAQAWAMIVQAPFSDGATVVVDWVDEGHFSQLRYEPATARWWIDHLAESEWNSENIALDFRPRDTTLSIRRTVDAITIELPDGRTVDVAAPLPVGTNKVGVRWTRRLESLGQFDIGPIGLDWVDREPAAGVNTNAGPTATSKSSLTNRDAIQLGESRYTTTYLPGDEHRGGSTLFLPQDSSGSNPPIVIALPGYLSGAGSIAWLGPNLASRGTAVLVASTLLPESGTQARSADFAWLSRFIKNDEKLNSLVDTDRIFWAGHSASAGGAFYRSALAPDATGLVALAPWLAEPGQERVIKSDVPTLVISCENDATATYDEQVVPILEEFHGNSNLDWFELAGGEHECTTNREQNGRIRAFVGDRILAFIQTATEGRAASDPPDKADRSEICGLIGDGSIVSRSSTDCS